MRRIAFVALASLVLGYVGGRAQGKYAVYGQGNQSWGRWTAQNKERRDNFQHTWALGFVSGAGWASSTAQGKTDSDAIAAWIDQYCAAHPLNNISTAAGALVIELEKR